jgi:hypothetical protein
MLEIVNLQKHEIFYMERKKQKLFSVKFLSLIVCVIAFCISFIDLNYFENIKKVVALNNPVNSLYNDNSNVVFTNSNKLLNFIIPISGGSFSIENDGSICFRVGSSIMVTACEDGIVEYIGYSLNGKKCIKIKHTDNIYTLIENVDIVGVAINDIVKKGKDIATAKMGEFIVLRLFKNNNQVNNIKVENGKIIWQE